MGLRVGGSGFGGRWVALGHGDLGLMVGELVWACFGLGRAYFPFEQGEEYVFQRAPFTSYCRPEGLL